MKPRPCPHFKYPQGVPWGYDHCRMRFALSEAFPDNGCKDCPVHLKEWAYRKGISI